MKLGIVGLPKQETGKSRGMQVLVLNGSPSGKNSITLQTVLFLEQYYKEVDFEILHVGSGIKQYEKDFGPAAEALQKADLVLFCYPVYTFLVPAQLHRFMELAQESGIDLKGKYATQISTSKHFYDVTAHRFIQDYCDDMGMRYIRGLSADMEDLLSKKGQKEALSFFRFVRWNMRKGFCEPAFYPAADVDNLGSDPMEGGADVDNFESGAAAGLTTAVDTAGTENAESAEKEAPAGKIAVVADFPVGQKTTLTEMIGKFQEESRLSCEIINIREFPFQGGCLGCFHCAADGTCVYKDGFDEFLRSHIQSCDAIVYAYTVKNHSMGSRFKMFDDRQFCNGHRTVTMGKPVGYLVDGDLSREENLRMVMEARAQVGGNFLAGIACSERDAGREIRMLAATLAYAVRKHYEQPKNFYGVGGLKIFRDLIYQMQGLMREDHRFYKEHGFYDDFPQKKKGRILGMYLVGAMMTNKKLRKKLGGKMTEGMLMPYKGVRPH